MTTNTTITHKVRVQHNGQWHAFETLADAKAFRHKVGLAPDDSHKPAKRQFASETNGVCNRCGGSGDYYTPRANGKCFRCVGTGRAPGFTEAEITRNAGGAVVGLAEFTLVEEVAFEDLPLPAYAQDLADCVKVRDALRNLDIITTEHGDPVCAN